MIKKWFRNLLLFPLLGLTINANGQCGFFDVDYTVYDGAPFVYDDVVCQVFKDISQLIEPTGTPLVRINVNIVDIGDFPSGVFAEGYPIKQLYDYEFSDVYEGAVWDYLTTGVDPFLPFNEGEVIGIEPHYYHGIINLADISFNNNLEEGALEAEKDLYTIILQEVMHLLGINTEMNNSTFKEAGYFNRNIYSSYDTHLYKDDIPLLTNLGPYERTAIINSTNFFSDCNGSSDVSFEGNLSKEPVFTSGYSLSLGLPYHLEHLQDDCNFNDNLEYVMGFIYIENGITRRIPTQEEVNMLCDLGYQTNIFYGGDYSISTKTDFIPCGEILAGADDSFVVTHNAEFTFSDADLLANDISIDNGQLKVKYLESLDGIPIIEYPENSGLYKMDIPEVWGEKYFLLRYKPVNQLTGREGNTTVVILNTSGNICSGPEQHSCNLLCDGNFNDVSRGLIPYDHWDVEGNSFLGSNFVYRSNSTESGTGHSIHMDTRIPGEGNNPGISPGLYMPFHETLSTGTTYNVSFTALNTGTPGIIYFMGSTNTPCKYGTGVYNDIAGGIITPTDCGDGNIFNPVLLASQEIASDGEWTDYSFNFLAEQDFENFVFFLLKDETEYYILNIDEIFIEPYINDSPAGEDALICGDGEGIQIGYPGLDGFPEGTVFHWTPETGLSDPNIGNPIANPLVSTTYTLGINMGECGLIQDEIEVAVTENCCDVLTGDFDFNNKTASEVINEFNGGIADFVATEQQSIKINSLFTIDTDISFDNFLFEMGENAEIIFNGGFGTKKLKLNNCLLEACGDKMWEGIVLDENIEKIEMNNSEVRDAKQAIYISNCAKYDIYFDNNFHANFRDIAVTDCDVATSEENYRIEKNIFISEVLLLEPYNDGTVGDYAIWATDVVELKTTLNRIDNYPHAIFIKNSNLTMEDNTINYDPLLGTGGFAVALSMHESGKTLYSYEDDINNYNYGISNYIIGMESSKGIHLDVVGSYFNDIARRALDIRRLGSNTHNQVLNNSFTNVTIGIAIQEIFPSGPSLFEPEDLTVSGNTMTNVSQKGMWFTNLYSGTGTSGTYEEVRIENNTQITMAPYSGGTQSAIQVEKCRRIVVDNNNMSRADLSISPSAYDFVRGLSIADTEGGRFTNNSSTNMGSGIHVLGQNHFSQWECNELDYCYRGFYFDPNNAVISDQGTLYNPTDNQWVDRPTGFSERIDGGLDLDLLVENPKKWHYRNLSDYLVILSFDAIGFFDPILLGNTAPYCDGSAPSGGSGGIAGMALSEGLDALEGLSNGSNTYNNYNETYQYRDQEMVYRTMEASPSLQGERIALDNFFNAIENSGIAMNIDIQKDMELAEVEAALAKNESWLTDNLYQAHSKTVNGIYLNSIAIEEEMSATDIESLESIALTTPYLSGDAVYSARVILGIDAGDSGIAYRLSETRDTNVSHWYPNPTQGKISINFANLAKQSRKAYCYDLMGKLVYQKSLSLNNDLIDMDLSHFTSGIYFIEIEQDNQSIIFDKLIVTD